MPNLEAQSISIAMSDSSAGYEVTPARVRLAALADFTRDVTDFLAGEDREIDVNSLDVAVVPGSVAIQTAPIVHAPSLIRDLSNLLASPLLDALDSKRRKVVERWQRGSRKLIAQCVCEGITHLITEDQSTLVKYLARAKQFARCTTSTMEREVLLQFPIEVLRHE